jgi:hypothetical protein
MRLTSMEGAWAKATLSAIFPGSTDGRLAGIDAMDVRGYLASAMERIPFRAALGLRAAVWVAALAPLFLLGRIVTIAALARAERENVVARLFASRSYGLRSLMMMLKTFGALCYAGDATVRARLMAPQARRSLVPLRLGRAGTRGNPA